ncbi:MAG: outer membrane protein assembly factor BamB family protein [Armatimonadota bacterium]
MCPREIRKIITPAPPGRRFAVFFAVMLTLAALLPASSASNWPMMGNNEMHTGASSLAAPAAAPAIKWLAQLGAASQSTPAMTHDNNFAIVGTDDGRVLWVRMTDGAIVQTMLAAGRTPFRATPVVAQDGSVFAVNMDGRLYCHEVNGTEWHAPNGGAPPWGPLVASPMLLTIQGHEYVLVASTDGNLYLVDRNKNQTGSAITPLAGAVRAGNVVTITTTLPHGLNVNDVVRIQGMLDASFNGGPFTVTGRTATTITYDQTDVDAVSYGATVLRVGPTIDVAPTGAVRAGNTVTITTTANHFLAPNDVVNIEGVADASFNTGPFIILTAPTATTFTYAQAGVDATSGGGTVIEVIGGSTPGMVRLGNVVTVTTMVPNDVNTGDFVQILGVNDPSFDGYFTVTRLNGKQFTYAQVGPDAVSGDGTVLWYQGGAHGTGIWYTANGSIESTPAIELNAHAGGNSTLDQALPAGQNYAMVTGKVNFFTGDEFVLSDPGNPLEVNANLGYITNISGTGPFRIDFTGAAGQPHNAGTNVSTIPHRPLFFGCNDGRVYSVNADERVLSPTTGRWLTHLRFAYPGTTTRAQGFLASPLLDGSNVYIGDRGGRFYVIDKLLGTLVNNPDLAVLPGPFTTAALAAGNVLFAGYGGRGLARIDIATPATATPAVVASADFAGAVTAQPVVSSNNLVLAGDTKGGIYAENAGGTLAWSWPGTPRGVAVRASTILADADTILAPTMDGQLICLAPGGLVPGLPLNHVPTGPWSQFQHNETHPGALGVIPDAVSAPTSLSTSPVNYFDGTKLRWSHNTGGAVMSSAAVTRNGDIIRQTTLAVDASAGSLTFTLADVSNLYVGDILLINQEYLGPITTIDRTAKKVTMTDASEIDHLQNEIVQVSLYRRDTLRLERDTLDGQDTTTAIAAAGGTTIEVNTGQIYVVGCRVLIQDLNRPYSLQETATVTAIAGNTLTVQSDATPTGILKNGYVIGSTVSTSAAFAGTHYIRVNTPSYYAVGQIIELQDPSQPNHHEVLTVTAINGKVLTVDSQATAAQTLLYTYPDGAIVYSGAITPNSTLSAPAASSTQTLQVANPAYFAVGDVVVVQDLPVPLGSGQSETVVITRIVGNTFTVNSYATMTRLLMHNYAVNATVTGGINAFQVMHPERFLLGDTITLVDSVVPGRKEEVIVTGIRGDTLIIHSLSTATRNDHKLNYDFTLGSTIWVGHPGQWTVYIGSDDGYLRAIDPDNGPDRDTRYGHWQNSVEQYLGKVRGTPVVDNRLARVYATSVTGRLFAFAQNGQYLWAYPRLQSPSVGPISVSPVLDEQGNIYFATQTGYVYKVTPDGILAKKVSAPAQDCVYPVAPTPVPGAIESGLALYRTDENDPTKLRLLFGTRNGVQQGKIVSLDLDLNKVWIYPDDFTAAGPAPRTPVVDAITTTPVVDSDGVIFIGDRAGHVHALYEDATNNVRSLWVMNPGADFSPETYPAMATPGPQITALAVAANVLYAGDNAGTVHAVGIPYYPSINNNPALVIPVALNNFTLDAPITGPFTLDDSGNLVVSTGRGSVYCLPSFDQWAAPRNLGSITATVATATAKGTPWTAPTVTYDPATTTVTLVGRIFPRFTDDAGKPLSVFRPAGSPGGQSVLFGFQENDPAVDDTVQPGDPIYAHISLTDTGVLWLRRFNRDTDPDKMVANITLKGGRSLADGIELKLTVHNNGGGTAQARAYYRTADANGVFSGNFVQFGTYNLPTGGVNDNQLPAAIFPFLQADDDAAPQPGFTAHAQQVTAYLGDPPADRTGPFMHWVWSAVSDGGMPAGLPLETAPALYAGHTVIVGSDDGTIYAIGQRGPAWTSVVRPDQTVVQAFGKWPFFHQDARRGGALALPGAVEAGPPHPILRWFAEHGNKVQGTPVVTDRTPDGIVRVYVGTDEGKIYAYEASTGVKLWEYQLPGQGPIRSAVSIHTDGAIAVAAMDGCLYLLNPDGTLKWSTKDAASANKLLGSFIASPVFAKDGTVYGALADTLHTSGQYTENGANILGTELKDGDSATEITGVGGQVLGYEMTTLTAVTRVRVLTANKGELWLTDNSGTAQLLGSFLTEMAAPRYIHVDLDRDVVKVEWRNLSTANVAVQAFEIYATGSSTQLAPQYYVQNPPPALTLQAAAPTDAAPYTGDYVEARLGGTVWVHRILIKTANAYRLLIVDGKGKTRTIRQVAAKAAVPPGIPVDEIVIDRYAQTIIWEKNAADATPTNLYQLDVFQNNLTGSGGAVYAFAPADGKIIWKTDPIAPVISSPAVVAGDTVPQDVLFVGTTGGQLMAVKDSGLPDLVTFPRAAAILWTDEEYDPVTASPVLVDNPGGADVFVADGAGDLHFVHGTTGEEISGWPLPTQDESVNAAAVNAEKLAYLPTVSGRVFLLNLSARDYGNAALNVPVAAPNEDEWIDGTVSYTPTSKATTIVSRIMPNFTDDAGNPVTGYLAAPGGGQRVLLGFSNSSASVNEWAYLSLEDTGKLTIYLNGVPPASRPTLTLPAGTSLANGIELAFQLASVNGALRATGFYRLPDAAGIYSDSFAPIGHVDRNIGGTLYPFFKGEDTADPRTSFTPTATRMTTYVGMAPRSDRSYAGPLAGLILQLPVDVKSSPVIDSLGRVFFGSDSGDLYCLKSEAEVGINGDVVRWHYRPDRAFFSTEIAKDVLPGYTVFPVISVDGFRVNDQVQVIRPDGSLPEDLGKIVDISGVPTPVEAKLTQPEPGANQRLLHLSTVAGMNVNDRVDMLSYYDGATQVAQPLRFVGKVASIDTFSKTITLDRDLQTIDLAGDDTANDQYPGDVLNPDTSSRVFVGRGYGYIITSQGPALQRSAGDLLRIQLGVAAPIRTSPSVGPQQIAYLGANDGLLYAIGPASPLGNPPDLPLLPSQSSASIWWTFHHDNQRTGYADRPGAYTKDLRWYRDTGSTLESSPALGAADGTAPMGVLYQGSADVRDQVGISQQRGALLSYNASSGQLRWRVDDNGKMGKVLSSPAVFARERTSNNGQTVRDELVVFGTVDVPSPVADIFTGAYLTNGTLVSVSTGALGLQGGDQIMALVVTDGSTFESGTEVYLTSPNSGNNFEMVGTVSSISGNVLYLAQTWTALRVHLFGETLHSQVTQQGHIYCVDRTGEIHWKYPPDGALVSERIGPVHSSPVVDNSGIVYFGTDDGAVYALNMTGELLWSYVVPRGWYAPDANPNPALNVQWLYDSTKVFNQAASETTLQITSSPTLNETGTKLFIGVSIPETNKGYLVALDLATPDSDRRLLWKRPFFNDLDADNQPDDGEWMGPVTASPLISRVDGFERIFIGTDDMNSADGLAGRFYCINPDIGGNAVDSAGVAIGPVDTGPIYSTAAAVPETSTTTYVIEAYTGGATTIRLTSTAGLLEGMRVKIRIATGTADYVVMAVDLNGQDITLDRAIPGTPLALRTNEQMILVGSLDGKLYSFTEKLQPLGTFPTGGPVLSSPAISTEENLTGTGVRGYIVYFGSNDFFFYALNALPIYKTFGAPLVTFSSNPLTMRWQKTLRDRQYSSPAIGLRTSDSGRAVVYQASRDQYIYAFGDQLNYDDQPMDPNGPPEGEWIPPEEPGGEKVPSTVAVSKSVEISDADPTIWRFVVTVRNVGRGLVDHIKIYDTLPAALCRPDAPPYADPADPEQPRITHPYSFQGQGPDDFITAGVFTGAVQRMYQVQIVTTGTAPIPDTFVVRWADVGGPWSAWSAPPTDITGGVQPLDADGATITFLTLSGHTAGDTWTFTADPNAVSWELIWPRTGDGYSLNADVRDPTQPRDQYMRTFIFYLPVKESTRDPYSEPDPGNPAKMKTRFKVTKDKSVMTSPLEVMDNIAQTFSVGDSLYFQIFNHPIPRELGGNLGRNQLYVTGQTYNGNVPQLTESHTETPVQNDWTDTFVIRLYYNGYSTADNRFAGEGYNMSTGTPVDYTNSNLPIRAFSPWNQRDMLTGKYLQYKWPTNLKANGRGTTSTMKSFPKVVDGTATSGAQIRLDPYVIFNARRVSLGNVLSRVTPYAWRATVQQGKVQLNQRIAKWGPETPFLERVKLATATAISNNSITVTVDDTSRMKPYHLVLIDNAGGAVEAMVARVVDATTFETRLPVNVEIGAAIRDEWSADYDIQNPVSVTASGTTASTISLGSQAAPEYVASSPKMTVTNIGNWGAPSSTSQYRFIISPIDLRIPSTDMQRWNGILDDAATGDYAFGATPKAGADWDGFRYDPYLEHHITMNSRMLDLPHGTGLQARQRVNINITRNVPRFQAGNTRLATLTTVTVGTINATVIQVANAAAVKVHHLVLIQTASGTDVEVYVLGRDTFAGTITVSQAVSVAATAPIKESTYQADEEQFPDLQDTGAGALYLEVDGVAGYLAGVDARLDDENLNAAWDRNERLYFDLDADGVYDANEPCLVRADNDMRVFMDMNGNRTWDAGEPYYTATTPQDTGARSPLAEDQSRVLASALSVAPQVGMQVPSTMVDLGRTPLSAVYNQPLQSPTVLNKGNTSLEQLVAKVMSTMSTTNTADLETPVEQVLTRTGAPGVKYLSGTGILWRNWYEIQPLRYQPQVPADWRLLKSPAGAERPFGRPLDLPGRTSDLMSDLGMGYPSSSGYRQPSGDYRGQLIISDNSSSSNKDTTTVALHVDEARISGMIPPPAPSTPLPFDYSRLESPQTWNWTSMLTGTESWPTAVVLPYIRSSAAANQDEQDDLGIFVSSNTPLLPAGVARPLNDIYLVPTKTTDTNIWFRRVKHVVAAPTVDIANGSTTIYLPQWMWNQVRALDGISGDIVLLRQKVEAGRPPLPPDWYGRVIGKGNDLNGHFITVDPGVTVPVGLAQWPLGQTVVEVLSHPWLPLLSATDMNASRRLLADPANPLTLPAPVQNLASSVAETVREPLTADANGNGQYDPGDTYTDLNGNGQWDDGNPFLIWQVSAVRTITNNGLVNHVPTSYLAFKKFDPANPTGNGVFWVGAPNRFTRPGEMELPPMREKPVFLPSITGMNGMALYEYGGADAHGLYYAYGSMNAPGVLLTELTQAANGDIDITVRSTALLNKDRYIEIDGSIRKVIAVLSGTKVRLNAAVTAAQDVPVKSTPVLAMVTGAAQTTADVPVDTTAMIVPGLMVVIEYPAGTYTVAAVDDRNHNATTLPLTAAVAVGPGALVKAYWTMDTPLNAVNWAFSSAGRPQAWADSVNGDAEMPMTNMNLVFQARTPGNNYDLYYARVAVNPANAAPLALQPLTLHETDPATGLVVEAFTPNVDSTIFTGGKYRAWTLFYDPNPAVAPNKNLSLLLVVKTKDGGNPEVSTNVTLQQMVDLQGLPALVNPVTFLDAQREYLLEFVVGGKTVRLSLDPYLGIVRVVKAQVAVTAVTIMGQPRIQQLTKNLAPDVFPVVSVERWRYIDPAQGKVYGPADSQVNPDIINVENSMSLRKYPRLWLYWVREHNDGLGGRAYYRTFLMGNAGTVAAPQIITLVPETRGNYTDEGVAASAAPGGNPMPTRNVDMPERMLPMELFGADGSLFITRQSASPNSPEAGLWVLSTNSRDSWPPFLAPMPVHPTPHDLFLQVLNVPVPDN